MDEIQHELWLRSIVADEQIVQIVRPLPRRGDLLALLRLLAGSGLAKRIDTDERLDVLEVAREKGRDLVVDETHSLRVNRSLLHYRELLAKPEVVGLRHLDTLDNVADVNGFRHPVFVELLHALRDAIEPMLRFLKLLHAPPGRQREYR